MGKQKTQTNNKTKIQKTKQIKHFTILEANRSLRAANQRRSSWMLLPAARTAGSVEESSMCPLTSPGFPSLKRVRNVPPPIWKEEAPKVELERRRKTS